jgi:16S rRNA (uracil1498-N3)-methyltransferase
MSERFYINWPLQKGPVVLQGAEAHHLSAVCRLHPGDAVCLFNGDGHEYPARVVAVDRRQVELEILDRAAPNRELPCRLEVAAPLPKGDRARFLVEKLTELGVTTFIPLATTRTIVHPRDAKLEKLERYIIEASKQCGRNVLMEVQEVLGWSNYCRRDNSPGRRWFGQRGGQTKLINLGKDGYHSHTAWAVGPEGGLTDEEIQTALAAGWSGVDLGPRILRVETAALIVPAIINGEHGPQGATS